MGLLFKPNGMLNVATAATDLPAQINESSVMSEAMTRCKNMRIDRKGLITTRDGSSKINATAFASNTELVTNGTFASDISSWTDNSVLGGSISWHASGYLQLAAGGGTAIADQTVTISSTNVEHTFSIESPTVVVGASYDILIGTSIGGSDLLGPITVSAGSNYSGTFTPTGASAFVRIQHNTGGDTVVDNVSVKRSVDPVNLIVEQGGARYEFAGPQIFRNESSIASGLTDAQWSAIKYNQFNDTTQQLFALNGTDRKRLTGTTVAEWGITPPSSAPTVAVGTGTGLTGAYKAKVTYCRKVGSVVVSESNPSSASGSQSLSNEALRVTWSASSDSQVTHVRVYRTLANGDLYYHDQDVAIGTVTVDTTTADASLGDEVATDHDRPPLGTVTAGPTFGGTCFIIKDNLLHYCKPKQPEYWPTDYYVEVSTVHFAGKALVFYNGQPYYLTTNEIFLIQGTGHNVFLPIRQNAKTGAQGVFGAIAVKGKGIFHTGLDGVYLFAGEDRKITEERFEPIFRGEAVNGIPGVSNMTTAMLFVFGNNLYFGYTSTGYDYPTNFLVINLDTFRSSYFEYNDGSVVSFRCLAHDVTNNRLLAGDTSGFVREIEDQDVTSDSGTAISWEVQSMDYTLQTRRHFPRWAKYDVDASGAASCTGEIIVDGSTLQSHTITGNRNTRYRLITTGNGKRCALKISGSGPATVYAGELE